MKFTMTTCFVLSYALVAVCFFVGIMLGELHEKGFRRGIKNALAALLFSIGWLAFVCIFAFVDFVLPSLKEKFKDFEHFMWNRRNNFNPFDGVDEQVFAILKAEKETEAIDKKIENLYYDPFD